MRDEVDTVIMIVNLIGSLQSEAALRQVTMALDTHREAIKSLRESYLAMGGSKHDHQREQADRSGV